MFWSWLAHCATLLVVLVVGNDCLEEWCPTPPCCATLPPWRPIPPCRPSPSWSMVIYSSTSSTSILGAAHNMKWLSGRMEIYPPSCEELYFQQKLCREGKTNAHRGTNPAVGWGKCESRELPWNPGFLWPSSTRPNNYIFRNTKYKIPKTKYEIQNTKIFPWKKMDVVVGRVPWWWWRNKKALLTFSSSQEFLLPSECLNIQHRVLCGNKTNILQTIWCTKNQKGWQKKEYLEQTY